MQKISVWVAVLLGVGLLFVAGMYAIHPAYSLPHFLPGYSANLTKHHYTHAAAAAGLGLVCFAYAWFASGKKKSSQKQENS